MGRAVTFRHVPHSPEQVNALPVTDEERLTFSGHHSIMNEEGMAVLNSEATVTLTLNQWAMVMAGLRAAMAFATHPGLLALAHQSMYPQLDAQQRVAIARQRADGNPEGETQ